MRIALTLRLGFDRAICTASVFVDRLVGMAGMASAVPFGLQPLLASIALNPTIPEWLPWAGTLPLSKRPLGTWPSAFAAIDPNQCVVDQDPPLPAAVVHLYLDPHAESV